jgi:hypothetical protein
MGVRRLIRLAGVLILAGLLATAVLFLPDDLQFLAEARPMQGTVIAVDKRRQGILSYEVARVQIRVENAILHYPVEVNLFDRVHTGEQVGILYNPKMAPSLRFATPFGRYQSLDVFVLIAGGVIAALLVRLIVGALLWPTRRK